MKLRNSLKFHLREYLKHLANGRNSILFDIPEFGFQLDLWDKDRPGYSMSKHRLTRDYPLEDQITDIARLNQWFNTTPWDQGDTVSRKAGRFEITLEPPLVEPIFGNIVVFTLIIPTIIIFDGA